MIKAYLVKGKIEREIDAAVATELMYYYGIAGATFNFHGQVIYLNSRNRKRIHSILLRVA